MLHQVDVETLKTEKAALLARIRNELDLVEQKRGQLVSELSAVSGQLNMLEEFEKEEKEKTSKKEEK